MDMRRATGRRGKVAKAKEMERTAAKPTGRAAKAKRKAEEAMVVETTGGVRDFKTYILVVEAHSSFPCAHCHRSESY